MNNTEPQTLADLLDPSQFYFVSIREKSEPSPGTPGTPIEALDPAHLARIRIIRTINHRSGDVTAVVPNIGYVKFWHI